MAKDKERRTLMVFGGGRLGGPLVDLMSALYPNNRYIVVRRSIELASRRINLTRYMCSQWGIYPDIDVAISELTNVDQTASLIAKHKPDIIFNATTPFPWWKLGDLPGELTAVANRAGPGVWSALDCILPLKITQALASAGSSAIYVNGCYPDMVNAFLKGLPSSPILGIGNLSNLIPGLTLTYAQQLGVCPTRIMVRLICHHYTSLNAPTMGGSGGAPYHLTIDYPEGSITFRDGDDAPFKNLKASFSRVRGLEGQGVTINSAATVLASLLKGEQRRHHTPGALGLPGGYPVVLSVSGEPKIDLPKDLSLQDAVIINESAQRFDGIEHVVSGKVDSTTEARNAFQKIVDMELPTVTLENVSTLASATILQLNAKYKLGLSL